MCVCVCVWGGIIRHIHIFVFTDRKNRFQKALFTQIMHEYMNTLLTIIDVPRPMERSVIRANLNHENICCRRKPESTTFRRSLSVKFHTRISGITISTSVLHICSTVYTSLFVLSSDNSADCRGKEKTFGSKSFIIHLVDVGGKYCTMQYDVFIQQLFLSYLVAFMRRLK